MFFSVEDSQEQRTIKKFSLKIRIDESAFILDENSFENGISFMSKI